VASALARSSRTQDIVSCIELPGTPQMWLFRSWSASICLRRRARIRAWSLYSVVKTEIGRYSSGVRGLVDLGRQKRIPCFCLWDMCLSRNKTRTNVVCFRRVLPSRVNVLGYLGVWQTTTLSQHPSVEAELANYTPRKINDL